MAGKDFAMRFDIKAVDKFSPVMKKAAENAVTSADKIAGSDAKMAAASEKLSAAQANATKSTEGRINASRSIELQIQKEMAAGDTLAQNINRLEIEYEELRAKMDALVSAGQKVPVSMIRQAAASRRATVALREQQRAAQEAQNTFEKFRITGIAATAWTMAMLELGRAIEAVRKAVSDTLKPLSELHTEWTTLDKVLGSVKQTIDDPAFLQLNKIEQALVLTYRAVNTELAEVVARHEQEQLKVQERNKERRATMSLIDQEIQAEINARNQREENARRLAELDKAEQDRREKRAAAIRRERAEQERERRARERAAQAYIDMERRKQEAYVEARRQERAAKVGFWQSDQRLEMAGEAWLKEMRAKSTDNAKKNAEQQQRAYAQAALSIGQAMGNTFAQMIFDSKNAHKHFLTMLVDMVAMAIQAYAVQAAAAAGAGAGLGGPIAIGVASAAALGIVRGLIASLPEFQRGGIVQGPRNADGSVTIRAHEGERVLTVEQTEVFERMVSALERGAGAGGSVHLHQHTTVPPTTADTLRQVRAVGRQTARLKRLGQV